MQESNDFINYLDALKPKDLSSILRLTEIILREIKPDKDLVQFIPVETFSTEGISVHFTKSFLKRLVPFILHFSKVSFGTELFRKYEGIQQNYINYLEYMAEQAGISDIVSAQGIAEYKSSIFVYSADDEFISLIKRLQKRVKKIKQGIDNAPRNLEMIKIRIKEDQNKLEPGYILTVNDRHTFNMRKSAQADALYLIAHNGQIPYDNSVYKGLRKEAGVLQQNMIEVFEEPKPVISKKGDLLVKQSYIDLKAS